MHRLKRNVGIALSGLILLICAVLPERALAATLSLVAEKNEVEVGETFDVSVLLDTEGGEVNALEIGIMFPSDRLQVVAPSTERSVIELWVGLPKFDNRTGIIEVRGGIPNGIRTRSGLIATIQFRANSSGSLGIQFSDKTRVLANDGLGTDVLTRTTGIFIVSRVPAPAGPMVISPTHPDEEKWVEGGEAYLEWESEADAQGYSYILNEEPIFEPDMISEGDEQSISYNGLSDGVYYFHIRTQSDDAWSGTTHYRLNIGVAPPVYFTLQSALSPIRSDGLYLTETFRLTWPLVILWIILITFILLYIKKRLRR